MLHGLPLKLWFVIFVIAFRANLQIIFGKGAVVPYVILVIVLLRLICSHAEVYLSNCFM